MKLVKPLLLLFCFSFLGSLSAQDLHYTLFNMSPLSLNPANTGAFFGSIRVGGIYRGQWWAVNSERGYNTPGGYLDAPIIRGFRDQDWVGVGATLIQDRSGSLNFITNQNMLSVAYHLGLGKKGNSVLTLGLQGGSINRSLNSREANTAGDFNGIGFDPTTDQALNSGGGGGMGGGQNMRGEQNDVETNYVDFRAGLLFKSKFDDFDNVEAGLAFGRINRPEYLF
ncbi:MAG TPA: PorP/SprF family type IX secretion system membrane protein, partial [Phaeodactylibacter sp.]|nr:PorP/SprF family type IX secretion system membrane protein [Phaeodactylibacter sp.]